MSNLKVWASFRGASDERIGSPASPIREIAWTERAAPVLVAAIVACVYLIWRSPSADLSAQFFRADQFAAHGFLIWNNYWYSGHYLLGYSVLAPPLMRLLGPPLSGALAVVAAAAGFTALAQHAYGRRATLASLWFAVAAASELFTGRITFALGVAVGLATLLALQRRHLLVAGVLAAMTGLTSPVASLFLIVAAVAVGMVDRSRRAIAAAVGGSALAATLMLSYAFPTGGSEPFPLSSFLKVVLFGLVMLWLLQGRAELRIGVGLYILLATLAYAIPTALGDNVTRLGTLFAGPVLSLSLSPHAGAGPGCRTLSLLAMVGRCARGGTLRWQSGSPGVVLPSVAEPVGGRLSESRSSRDPAHHRPRRGAVCRAASHACARLAAAGRVR